MSSHYPLQTDLSKWLSAIAYAPELGLTKAQHTSAVNAFKRQTYLSWRVKNMSVQEFTRALFRKDGNVLRKLKGIGPRMVETMQAIVRHAHPECVPATPDESAPDASDASAVLAFARLV